MAFERSVVLMLAAACLLAGCVLAFSSDAKPPEAISAPSPPEETQPAGAGSSRRFIEQIPLT